MLKNCKSAQTKAQYYGIQKTTSERSEWFHKNKFDIMMAWMTPVSLHFSDVPTGSNNLNRQTTLATDLARSPRTVSPGEQWCKLICERSEWFHKNKFDIMMAWMTPVSLHFSNVSTGSNNLYRLTTLGYWFSTFATNSLSRRTVVQINFCPPHSVPCATWPANLPAATRPPRHRGDCAKGARQVFSQAATGRHPLQSSCNPRRAKHIKPQQSPRSCKAIGCQARHAVSTDYRSITWKRQVSIFPLQLHLQTSHLLSETHLVHSFTSEPRNVQRTIQCEASALSVRNWKNDSWVWHTK